MQIYSPRLPDSPRHLNPELNTNLTQKKKITTRKFYNDVMLLSSKQFFSSTSANEDFHFESITLADIQSLCTSLQTR